MGRLGFNLVRQKEANKGAENVETGAVPDQQQNEKNEQVEVSELILAIDERNKTVKNYRILLATLTAVIICLCGYILLTQAKVFQSTQEAVTTINKLHEYSSRMEALQGQYEALNSVKLDQARNCSLEESTFNAEKEKLQREVSLRSKENLEINEKYSILQESFDTLKDDHEALAAHCSEKEADLQAQVKKLQDERAELLQKVEANNRRVEQQRSNNKARSTPRSTTLSPLADQLKKFNDIVKDIESGAVLFNIGDFMKKTDEVFRI